MRSLRTLVLELVMLLTTILVLSSTGSAAAAVNIFPTCQTDNTPEVCKDVSTPSTTDPVILVIKAAMEVISFITGAAAIILVIISAIRFVTSGGQPEAVAGARSTIVYALVGVVITVLAQSIIAFVLNKING
jgi:hypothetical protein